MTTRQPLTLEEIKSRLRRDWRHRRTLRMGSAWASLDTDVREMIDREMERQHRRRKAPVTPQSAALQTALSAEQAAEAKGLRERNLKTWTWAALGRRYGTDPSEVKAAVLRLEEAPR